MNEKDNFRYDNNKMESKFDYSACEKHQNVSPADVELKENEKPIFGAGYNFKIYEDLLSSNDMPEEQWKLFAEICMEEMICQIRVAQRKMETLAHNIEMIQKTAVAN